MLGCQNKLVELRLPFAITMEHTEALGIEIDALENGNV